MPNLGPMLGPSGMSNSVGPLIAASLIASGGLSMPIAMGLANSAPIVITQDTASTQFIDATVPGSVSLEESSSSSFSSDVPWLQKAMEIAADSSVGYSQPTRYHNPNMDCTSFVYYSLTECGIESLGTNYLGVSPFAGGMSSVLQANGFAEHPFTGLDELQPGDILENENHTEIYMGRYDITNLDADGNPTPSADGTHLMIGAHNTRDNRDLAGWLNIAEHGDNPQIAEGRSNCWYGAAHEVSAVQASTNWSTYLRAENVRR